MANQFVKPTEAELEILHVLWTDGAQSVRYINDKLNEHRDPSAQRICRISSSASVGFTN